jgi:glycogen synthase
LRILHLLDHSLPLHSGYTFRTRAILKAQVGRGWDVRGVTGLRHLAEGPAQETVDGLTFERTPRFKTQRSPIGEIQEVQAFAAQIDRVVRAWKPDVLHAHSPVLDALAGLKIAKRYRLPFLYEIRAFWEDAAVAVICEGLRSDLIARGIAAEKIMVSPNGVDLDLFGDPPPPDEALARVLGLEGAEVIGFIGSFYDYEGLDDLIAAMPMVMASRSNAHLLLVGGGPMEAALRAQAKASAAAANIHFIGRVPHQDVERYYSLIDILAYPRKKMRLTDLVTPLKPLEAMAQRRLVAASNVGGHRELIEDGVTGTLFEPDNPDSIAKALSGLLADRSNWSKRLENGRKFVEQDRNWSSNISRYDPVYQKLTGLPV